MESFTVRDDEFNSIKRRCRMSSLSSDDTPSSQLDILDDQQDENNISEACKSISPSGIEFSDPPISEDYLQKSESTFDCMNSQVKTTGVDISLPTVEDDVYNYFHGFDVADVECIRQKGTLALLKGSNVFPTIGKANTSFHGFKSKDETLSELSDFGESGCEEETELSTIARTISTKDSKSVETTVAHMTTAKSSYTVEINNCNIKLRKAKPIAKKHRKKKFHKKVKIFPSKKILIEKNGYSGSHVGLGPISLSNLTIALPKSNINLEIEKANATEWESRLQDALKDACESFSSTVLADTTNLLPDPTSQAAGKLVCSSPIEKKYVTCTKNTLSRAKAVTEESALDLALGDAMVHWLTTGQVKTVYDVASPNCSNVTVSHCNFEQDITSMELVTMCNLEKDNQGKERLGGKDLSDQNKMLPAAGDAFEDPFSHLKTSIGMLSQSDGSPVNGQFIKAALYSTASASEELLPEVPYNCQLKLRLDPTQPQPQGTMTNVFHKAFLSTKENSREECFSNTFLDYTCRLNKANDHENRRLEKILTAQTSEHPDTKTPTRNFIYEPVKKRPKLMTLKRAINDDSSDFFCLKPSKSLPGRSHSQFFLENIHNGSEENKNSSCYVMNKPRGNLKRRPKYDGQQVAARRAKLRLKINLPSSSYKSLSDHFVMEAKYLEQPYLYGFHRSVVFRSNVKSGNTCDIYYYPANGKIKMRSVQDVINYIDAHPYLASNLSSRNFDFHKAQHNVGLPYEILRAASATHWRVRHTINDEDHVDAFDFAGFLDDSNPVNDFEGFDQIELAKSPEQLWLKDNSMVIEEPSKHSGDSTESNCTNFNGTYHGSKLPSDCQQDSPMDKGLSESLGKKSFESTSTVHERESFGKLDTLERKSAILAEFLAANSRKKRTIAECEVTTQSHGANLRINKQPWRQLLCRPLPLPVKSEPPTIEAIFGCTLTPEEPSPESGVPHFCSHAVNQLEATCAEPSNSSCYKELSHRETPFVPIQEENNMTLNPMPEIQCKLEPEPFETDDYYLSYLSPELQAVREENTEDGSERAYSSEPKVAREDHTEDGSEQTYSSEPQAVREEYKEDDSKRVYSSERQVGRKEHLENVSMLAYLSSGDDGHLASSAYEFIPISGPFCSTSLPLPIGRVQESEPTSAYAGHMDTDSIDVQPTLVDIPTDTNSERLFLILKGKRSQAQLNVNERPQVKEEEQLYDTDSYISEEDEEIDVLNLTSSPSKYRAAIGGKGSYSDQSLDKSTPLDRRDVAQEQDAHCLPYTPTYHMAKDKQRCVSSPDPLHQWSSCSPPHLHPCQMVGAPVPDASLRPLMRAGIHVHQSTQSEATSANSSVSFNARNKRTDRSFSPRIAASTTLRSTLMSEFVSYQLGPSALTPSPVMPLDLCTTRPPSVSSSSSPSQLVNDFVRENLVINHPISSTPPPNVVSALRHHYSLAGAPACFSVLNPETAFGNANDHPEPYDSPDRSGAHAIGSGVLSGMPSASGVLPSVVSSYLMTGEGQ